MTLFTIDEAADYLRVSKRTLYNWSSQRKIQAVKLGGLKFKKEYLDTLINSKQRDNGVHN